MILKENIIENNICNLLKDIGYDEYLDHFNINNLTQVIDYDELKKLMMKINSSLDAEYIELAIDKIKKLNYATSIEGNIKTLEWLKYGINIKIEKFFNREIPVYLIDYKDIENNSFKFIRQMNISAAGIIKIPDIVIYINGLPLSIIELKSPEAKEKLVDAYKQVVNYAKSHMNLMYWNIFSTVSNSFSTRYGAVTSEFNHWWSWKKTSIDEDIIQDIDYKDDVLAAENNYRKNIIGIYDKKTLLNILKNYIFYAKTRNTHIKYTPAYYQYYATEKAIKSLENAKYGRAGVVWHTQGSGKSVTMLFLASRIKSYFVNQNFKIIYVTDRNELDEQLYKRFCEAKNTYLFTEPKNITSRRDLIKTLSDDDDFGIYFTTIQKFTESDEPLSTKNNIIVIADEAHRSHNNIETDYAVDTKNHEIIEKEGYAKYIRDAFPNAKFIGFTGTPLMGNGKNTVNIFGDYIDKYPMNQAVQDGSTVPIHYEKRKVPILLDKIKLSELDEIYSVEMNTTNSDYIDNARYEHIKKKLLKVSNLLSDDGVIKTVVSDFWTHYDERAKALHGKAMFVAFNRKIAHLIYKEMIHQRPKMKDEIILVITGSNKDDEELQKLVPNDEQKKQYAIEFKKEDSKYKIAIVVDMWLTGFDVPDLDTLYLFKVIKWHNLMQTIARVNRTYNGNSKKKDGLIVDYIGIWQYIADALKQYAGGKDDSYNIDNVRLSLLDTCKKIEKTFFDKTNYIEKWLTSDVKDKFTFLVLGAEIIENVEKKDKDLFFSLVSKISRWYKLCRQILNNKEKLIAQYFILIKNYIRTLNVEEAIDVEEVLKKLKNKMEEIIKTGDIEISTIYLDGKKDLSAVYSLLEKELKLIKENKTKADYLKVKVLENEVKHQIKIFSTTNPLKAQKLSDDLIKLVEKYQIDKNIDEFLSGLIKFSKIMIESNELTRNIGDESIQAFYSILADDKFKMRNFNSEVLKEITLKIMNLIKDEITPQWWNNKRLRYIINNKIKVLLRTEYHYPPEDAKEISKIMIDQINNVVRRNPDYFIKEEDK